MKINHRSPQNENLHGTLFLADGLSATHIPYSKERKLLHFILTLSLHDLGAKAVRAACCALLHLFTSSAFLRKEARK